MAKKERAAWPAWRYDPKTGHGKIFQKSEDVPKGWTDDPSECAIPPFVKGEAESRSEPPAPRPAVNMEAPAAPASDNPNKGLAKANSLTKKAMQAELDEAGIEYDKSLGVDDLAAFYLSLPDEDEEEDEDGDEETEDEE